MTRRGQGVALSRLRRPLVGASVLGLLAVTLSGCSFDWTDIVGFGWPKGITPQAHANYQLWIGMVIASVVIGGLVWGMIFWTMIFHRKKATDTELPRQFGYNMPLELSLTVLPFLAVAVIFYFTVVVQQQMLELKDDPEVVVDVTAFQWNWKFGYQKVDFHDGLIQGYDGSDPEAKAAMTSKPEEGPDEHGVERRGPIQGLNTQDRTYLNFDKIETVGTTSEIPILVLPSGKRIEFQLNSADVIHSFWVPDFLFKRDVIAWPERNNQENRFQVSEITEEGAFVGHCAEMCGTYHAMMNFEVRVVSPNEFKAYLEQRKAGKSNAEALEAINQAPQATSTRPFDSRRGQIAEAADK
nr:cytochrome c oxidase subunit II [Mycolicibacter sp. MU0083]